jgi:hypothetical protein
MHYALKHDIRHMQSVDKIMETLRTGIEFVLATLKELQLATLNVFPSFIYIL